MNWLYSFLAYTQTHTYTHTFAWIYIIEKFKLIWIIYSKGTEGFGLLKIVTDKNKIEFPQKIKNRITIWFSHFTSGYISKTMTLGSWGNIFTSIFIVILFTRAKRWKQLKGTWMDESINKIWCLHTMQYCVLCTCESPPTPDNLMNDVHKVLAAAALLSSFRLKPVVSFMQSTHLIFDLSLSCRLLYFSALMSFPKPPASSWCAWRMRAPILSFLPPAVFQASFALGSTCLSFWQFRIFVEDYYSALKLKEILTHAIS